MKCLLNIHSIWIIGSESKNFSSGNTALYKRPLPTKKFINVIFVILKKNKRKKDPESNILTSNEREMFTSQHLSTKKSYIAIMLMFMRFIVKFFKNGKMMRFFCSEWSQQCKLKITHRGFSGSRQQSEYATLFSL